MVTILRRTPTLLVIAVAVALVASAYLLLREGTETKTLSANFSRAVQIFPKSEVRILGVRVGEVTAVVPAGNSVRVEMEYDAQYKVPADAKAVIITPTLTADRFVQLTPAYDGGEVIEDGAEIALDETGTPVELDRIYASLQELSRALGPSGANKDGHLNRLLVAGAATLDGQGRKANRMLLDLSRAARTFGEGAGPLFDSVRQLQQLVHALAVNDRFVASFIENTAGFSTQIAAEREELRAVLATLADTVGVVESFVRDNRDALTKDVELLGELAKNLVKQKESITTVLEKGPLGLGNLVVGFDVRSGGEGGRFAAGGNVNDFDGFLCSLVQQSQIPAKDVACTVFEQLLEPLLSGVPLTGEPPRGGGPGVPAPRFGSSTPADDLGGLLGGAG